MGSHISEDKVFPILEISVTIVSCEGVSKLCKGEEYDARSWLRLGPLRISGVARWSVDLLQLQIISLVRWEEYLHLQAIISPKGASALLLVVHQGS